MQTRPDQATLLEAVGSFLLSEISPKLEADKALQFRVLIAANLASVVANELRTQGSRLSSELSRVRELLEAPAGPESMEELDRLNRQLTGKLREGAITLDPVLEALHATAQDTLAVTNPRFDLADDPG